MNRVRGALATFEQRLCELLLHPWAETTDRARAERSWLFWRDDGGQALLLSPLGVVNGLVSRLPRRPALYVAVDDAGQSTLHVGRTVELTS